MKTFHIPLNREELRIIKTGLCIYQSRMEQDKKLTSCPKLKHEITEKLNQLNGILAKILKTYERKIQSQTD